MTQVIIKYTGIWHDHFVEIKANSSLNKVYQQAQVSSALQEIGNWWEDNIFLPELVAKYMFPCQIHDFFQCFHT